MDRVRERTWWWRDRTGEKQETLLKDQPERKESTPNYRRSAQVCSSSGLVLVLKTDNHL